MPGDYATVAAGDDPRVRVLFPIPPYTPTAPCAHFGPIRPGVPLYCPQCHDTGKRHRVRKGTRDEADREQRRRWADELVAINAGRAAQDEPPLARHPDDDTPEKPKGPTRFRPKGAR